MAEKGIKIADQLGGTAVATRDATEQTTGGVPRVVQLVDIASRQFTKTVHRAGISAADPADLTAAANMYAARLTVGDKPVLVTHFDVTPPADFTDVLVTPVLYAADNSIVGILASKRTGIGAAVLTGVGGKALLPSLQWDLFGAAKVALHVTALTTTGSVSLNIYAEVL